jgi:hypothetical protein
MDTFSQTVITKTNENPYQISKTAALKFTKNGRQYGEDN